MKSETNVFGAALTRRSFVRAGGALFVGFGMVGADGLKNLANAATTKHHVHRLPADCRRRAQRAV